MALVKAIVVVFPTVLTCVGQMPRHAVVVLGGERFESRGNLLHVAHALNAVGPSLSLAQRGEEHAGQDANNGNDHQQFYEGKSAALPEC